MQSWLVQRIGLWIILVVWLGLASWRLTVPAYPYFDEVYHVPAAELIAQGDVSAFEWWHPAYDGINYFDWLHPPIAKLIQAQAINWFGDSAFGWRVGSVVAGSLALWGMWELAWLWFGSRQSAWLATLFLATDGLFLVQSRIAMLDIYLVTELIWLVWLFGCWWKTETSIKKTWLHFRIRHLDNLSDWWLIIVIGLVAGLISATKWTGIWPVMALFAIEFGKDVSLRLAALIPRKYLAKLNGSKNSWRRPTGIRIGQKWSVWLVLVAGVYLASYTFAFGRGKTWQDIAELNSQALSYHLHRDQIHNYASGPIDWFLNQRATWYWGASLEEISASDVPENTTASIYAVGNPLQSLWLSASILGWLFFRAKQHKTQPKFSQFLWLSLYAASFIPWFFSPRILFYYHYLPAVPFGILLSLGWWRNQGWVKLGWTAMLSGLVIASFGMWYPHWVGLLVPAWLENNLYFLFSSWK